MDENIRDTGQAAAFLTTQGLPVSRHTLAALRVRGGGPPFWRWGPRRVRYRETDLMAWARRRLAPSEKSMFFDWE